jgi:hypothetical protein
MAYTSILVLLVGTVNLILDKILLGERSAKVSETKGKSIQLWGNTLICITTLIVLSFVYFSENSSDILVKAFFVIFLILALGFKAFLEWKFLKSYKKHQATLITLIVGIIFTVLFISK